MPAPCALDSTRIVKASDAGMRLDRWLHRACHTHFVQIQRWVRSGQVRVNGGRCVANYRLAAGDAIRIPPAGRAPIASRAGPSAKHARLVRSFVIDTTDSLWVLAKPAGLACQGGPNLKTHLDAMLPALAEHPEDQPCLVHRLDRQTSGVMLVARTPRHAESLARQFRERTIRKHYLAVLEACPKKSFGRIETALEEKQACTQWKILGSAKGKAFCLALIMPLTGRKHQIRIHMAALGCPVLGDSKYGSGESASSRLMLHAWRIFTPEGQQWTVPPPSDFMRECREHALPAPGEENFPALIVPALG